MEDIVNRFFSFRQWKQPVVSARAMALAGFCRLSDKASTCTSCGFVLDDSMLKKNDGGGDYPFQVHASQRPQCRYVRNFTDPRLEELKYLEGCAATVVQHTMPSVPVYKNPIKRLESFRSTPVVERWWSDRMEQDLVTAGFYYAGNIAKVGECKCFHCNVTVFGWHSTDDPWEIHAKFSPKCEFLRLHKTPDYIYSIAKSYVTSEMYWAMQLKEIRHLLSSPQHRLATMNLLRLNVNLSNPDNVYDMIKHVILDKPCPHLFEARDRSSNFVIVDLGRDTVDSICDTFDSAQRYQPQAVKEEEEDNEQQQQSLCIACKLAPATIASLPCAHCVLCFDCICTRQQCFVCKKYIRKVLRIYYG